MIGRNATESPLVEEFRISNTPVIGAYMLWVFAKEYVDATQNAGLKRMPNFVLFCFVAAIMSDRRILNEMKLKRGISSFRRNLSGERKGVLFDGIHDRVKDMLPYTLAALDIAYACGILKMNSETGEIEPQKVSSKSGTLSFISAAIKSDAALAKTLGRWFSKYNSPAEIARKLEVVL